MLWTRFFIPTVKETPADATAASHKLAIRAGLIRQVAAGSYSYLPLGYRTLRKVEEIIREEMNAAGAIELHMPALHPISLWEETGRTEAMGDVLMRIRGNGWQSSVCLGPTHEEVITEIARAYISSYKQLPINLYQIQTKFRGEERPKSGVLRTREFLMKDAYSFNGDMAGLDTSYESMYEAYCRIFSRCGLPYLAVEAESGPIGGDASHEFMVLTDAGEDFVALTDDRSYAANTERAERRIGELPADPDASAMNTLENLHTPGCPGIDDVCAFLKIKPTQMIKTLVYAVAGDDDKTSYVVACVRGDHEVNEGKLRRLVDGNPELCDKAEAAGEGFAIGYVGPHIANEKGVKLIVDPDARAVQNGVTGANAIDHHVKGFNWTRDVKADRLSQAMVVDIRTVVDGDIAPNGSKMSLQKAIEIGHVFKLGTKYSDSMGANFLDESGKPQPFIMGCYGIGVNRLLAAAIEAHHDDDGIIWPIQIAPFEVQIVALDIRDDEVMAIAKRIHDDLEGQDIDVLLDDRNQRPGFKFKDADLIGMPIRVTVGRKGLKDGIVELKMRDGGAVEKITPDNIVGEVSKRVAELKSQ
jgi:prolyl-tRNA synthetase